MINKSFRLIQPKSGQEQYYNSLRKNIITIATGVAGCGKSLLALGYAIEQLENKNSEINGVIIVRPYIKSAVKEDIGALPGDLKEKIDPFVGGIRDNLEIICNEKNNINFYLNNKIEFTILSMLRGRSFNNKIVIIDEAQNVPLTGDMLFTALTRIGKNCKMIIIGDLDQSDIKSKDMALPEAINILDGTEGVGIVEMNDVRNVHRSGMVRTVIEKFREYRKNG